jgi:hypothetical protein
MPVRLRSQFNVANDGQDPTKPGQVVVQRAAGPLGRAFCPDPVDKLVDAPVALQSV